MKLCRASVRGLTTAFALTASTVVLAAAACAPEAGKEAERQPIIHSYVVPIGTAERIERGENVEIMPRELEVRVGDTLVIRNDDSKTHTVGPVAVRAGETTEQHFTRPGVIEGECTVHPEEKFTLHISE